ncbi:B-cell receptor CD22-like [Cololabis saira]|uniref:B-cell receptor CD22-like n=1 Tax=Cololabis saira TaxID=129043 RepID=UPI002AD57091|nr:B-cell receptor CD22-like [Cololabis saira]
MSIQSYESGEYYCTSENELGMRTSEPINIDVKYAPKPPSVSVSPSGEIVEGTSVTLTCSSDANPAATHFWYRRNVHKPVSEKQTLVFISIQSSESGEYYCTSENELGMRTSEPINIDVRYRPKSAFVTVSPSGEIKEGSSVTLTCDSDANPAATYKYLWYTKDDNFFVEEKTQLSFTFIAPTDSGEYYCTASNNLGMRTSDVLYINVKYPPKPPSVSVNPSGEIVEGTSVTLTCSSDANPAATHSWYRRNVRTPISEEQTLFFTTIQSSESGEYYCTSENELGNSKSQLISIDVTYRPKPPFVLVSPSGDIVEGTSTTLICRTDANPAATYSWYRRNGHNYIGDNRRLIFRTILSSDSGEYYCAAENKLGWMRSENVFINVKYAPKPPSVSVCPPGEIVEGTSVTLTCSSDANPASKYCWYRRNVRTPVSQQPTLVFMSIQSSESGEYYCTSENELGSRTSESITMDVKYAPKPPSVSVSPSGEIVEGTSVTLTCSSDANPAATYSWYRRNVRTPVSEEQTLLFTSIQSSESGEYYCNSENELGIRTSLSINTDVKYPPKFPSVSVSPPGEIVEGGSVTLTCHSDANPAATYSWYQEDEDSPKASGQNFTINNITFQHSGNYYCDVQNTRGRLNSTYLHLNVVARAWKHITAATVPAVLLALIPISIIVWIIKGQPSERQFESEEDPDTREPFLQVKPVEDELGYANVYFSKEPEEALYSTIGAAQLCRHVKRKREEESKPSSASSSPSVWIKSEAAAADPATLYSSVKKPPKKQRKQYL